VSDCAVDAPPLRQRALVAQCDLVRILQIKVKPGSRVDELTELGDGTWQARVKALPVDGRANEALVALVAAHFGVRKAQVSIKSGASGPLKRVSIAG
jgi:uncharacterized protein YggU (UPF0235/DUF167 family)